MLHQLKSYIHGFSHLLFPKICVACQGMMSKHEETLCTICEIKLPYSNFYEIKDNPLEKRFWGRVVVERAGSLLFFEKSSQTQDLMQLLKYKGRQDIGEKLAILLANKLPKDSPFRDVDVIVPIPLHFKKLRKRGYNQCDKFAEKLGELLEVSIDLKSMSRIHFNVTQTGKSKIERWENVSQIFKVNYPEKLKGKHILIVDDVVTTGATLEAFAQEILTVENTKVSILTMACAV